MANKVIIGLESLGDMFARGHEIARRVDAGLTVPESDYHLNFSSAAQLFAELTPARLALLERLKREGPLSIHALSKTSGRNYSNVHRDVRKLMEHELVVKDEQGRVYVPWDEVVLRMTLASVA